MEDRFRLQKAAAISTRRAYYDSLLHFGRAFILLFARLLHFVLSHLRKSCLCHFIVKLLLAMATGFNPPLGVVNIILQYTTPDTAQDMRLVSHRWDVEEVRRRAFRRGFKPTDKTRAKRLRVSFENYGLGRTQASCQGGLVCNHQSQRRQIRESALWISQSSRLIATCRYLQMAQAFHVSNLSHEENFPLPLSAIGPRTNDIRHLVLEGRSMKPSLLRIGRGRRGQCMGLWRLNLLHFRVKFSVIHAFLENVKESMKLLQLGKIEVRNIDLREFLGYISKEVNPSVFGWHDLNTFPRDPYWTASRVEAEVMRRFDPGTLTHFDQGDRH